MFVSHFAYVQATMHTCIFGQCSCMYVIQLWYAKHAVFLLMTDPGAMQRQLSTTWSSHPDADRNLMADEVHDSLSGDSSPGWQAHDTTGIVGRHSLDKGNAQE